MFKKTKASLFSLSALQLQAQRYIDLVRELRPFLPILIPFLWWRGKKAYDNEMKNIMQEAHKSAVKQLEEARKEAQKRQKNLNSVAETLQQRQATIQKQGRK